ncbi:terminase large subunit [Planctomyces sp. SH-PL14]|uniref:terminase large subunit n=1 Tax=Planctomyces sp. SH-PL14 TaxID=1632864 RepID=UPI00078EB7E0|nr:terminase large subunit [Planctomyces sp. SH-PL14]AMV20420.1 Phage Terminase [Planctomyces sp. SH-PL14]
MQRLAVKRHLKDLKEAGARGFVFSEAHALEAIEFIERCCQHYKAEWARTPVILEPDQLFIVWCLFGWRHAETGFRRFGKGYICIARKWGKTLFAAVIALLLLVFDNPLEEGAEVYSVATKEDQAAIVFRDARAMVLKSAALKARLDVKKKVIEYPETNSFFRPLGSDSDGTDGLFPHGVIKDELHAWRGIHRGLHEKIDTGSGSRRQPLILTITTAGDDKSEIWAEEDDYAVRCVESVLTGAVFDDTLFSFICRIDDDDDPFDEACWIKANPHLGRTVKVSSYRTAANEARRKPSAISKLRRYYCNVKTASATRAILPEVWAKGNSPILEMKGRSGFGAFDMGRNSDFAAVALAFPRMVDGQMSIDLKVRSWTCRDTDLKLYQAPLAQFIERGELIVCEGDSISQREVAEYCIEMAGLAEIRSWAYDPSFAKLMAEMLQDDHGFSIFPFSQSERFYNEPIRTMLQMAKDGRLIHGGDTCLAWQAGNLTIKRNGKDEWGPAKIGGPFKIDGMVATLMAISECLYHGRESTDDEYEIPLI